MRKMVSEFIRSRIDAAHAMIDESYFEQAVELLKNIKHRVHEQSVISEINRFEQEHDSKLTQLLSGIHQSGEDPLVKDKNELGQWKKYSQSYLKFYDRISKDYDI